MQPNPANLIPDSTPAGRLVEIETQRRNRRNVLFDAVAIGLANAAAPYLPVFLTRLGASSYEVGLLTAMPGITGLILSLLVGRFLQTRRNVVPWFSLARLMVISAYALTGLVPFLVPDQAVVTSILVIWAAATLPQTMVAVGFSVVMNAVAGPGGRYDLMSKRWSIIGLTTAIAVAIVGQVLEVIGFPINYQIVFLALSMGGLFSFYFSSHLKIPDQVLAPRSTKRSLADGLKSYIKLIRSETAFISFASRRFVYMFGITLATPLFPLYYVREVNASDAAIGWISTAQTAVVMIGYLYWPRQTKRRGSRFVLLATTFAVSLFPALVGLTKSVELIILFAGLVGVFQAGIELVFFDELMKTVPPQYSPTFVSLAQSMQHLSAVLAPLAGTFLSEQIGLSGALIASTGMRLIGFLLFLGIKPFSNQSRLAGYFGIRRSK